MGEERATHEGPYAGPGESPDQERYGESPEARQAREEMEEAAREAGETMQEYGRELRHQGYEMAWQQQQALAGWLSRIGDAFGQSADQLRSSQDMNVAACLEATGDRAHGAASYLRQHDPQEVMDDATDFARRHPTWVIGGALLTGFVVSRFLKAAWCAEPEQESESQQARSEQPSEGSERQGASATAETAEPRRDTASPYQP